MIEFACPTCGRPIKVKPELAGRKGKCPGCQSVLVIPQPAAEPPKSESPQWDFSSSPESEYELEAPAPQPEVIQSSYEPPRPAYVETGPVRRKSSGQETQLPLGLGIGSVALGSISLVCGCCLGLFQIPVAVLALGLGIGGLVLSKGLQGAPRVLPIIGTIISGLSALLGILMITLYLIGIPVMEEMRKSIQTQQQQELQEMIDEAEVQEEIDRMQREEMEGLQPFSDDGKDPLSEPEKE